MQQGPALIELCEDWLGTKGRRGGRVVDGEVFKGPEKARERLSRWDEELGVRDRAGSCCSRQQWIL